MCGTRWPITLLVLCLFGSATSSPVSIRTPSPPLPLQILPPTPSPTILPSLPSPSLSIPPPTPPLLSNSAKSACALTISSSTLVVRFGDPVTANCSVQGVNFSLLGWEFSSSVPLNVTPEPTMDHFLVWSMDRMTYWNMEPMCYALSDLGGPCHMKFPLTAYKPPDDVSISIDNHTGPMFEGHQYTLQCTVHDVAPVKHLTVTFYRGQTVLGQLQSNNTEKTPVTDIFTLNINTSKEDDGAQYWCEAKLELGPEGPQPPPLVTSQKITATVQFGPLLTCPRKLQVRKGERLSCEVRGNPQPLVTWFKDGQVVALPTRSSREHAGKYTVMAKGPLEQKNFTVEVEVVDGSGTANSCNRNFLLAALLIQMINWL